MLERIKNIKNINQIKEKASVILNKAKDTTMRMVVKKMPDEMVITETTKPMVQAENGMVIDLFCLFAFKYQHRWTQGKQSVVERYCKTNNDYQYFEQLRHIAEQNYALFDWERVKTLFSDIRITQTHISFDRWAEVQQQIITDILHLFALSGCTAEEIQRESLAFSKSLSIPESVCQQAFYLQQSVQNSGDTPYNLAV